MIQVQSVATFLYRFDKLWLHNSYIPTTLRLTQLPVTLPTPGCGDIGGSKIIRWRSIRPGRHRGTLLAILAINPLALTHSFLVFSIPSVAHSGFIESHWTWDVGVGDQLAPVAAAPDAAPRKVPGSRARWYPSARLSLTEAHAEEREKGAEITCAQSELCPPSANSAVFVPLEK